MIIEIRGLWGRGSEWEMRNKCRVTSIGVEHYKKLNLII